MFEKPKDSRKNYRLPNSHNNGYEPITQSSLSLCTSRSDGYYGRRQHFQFGKTACGSTSNALIYGSVNPIGQLDISGIKPKVHAEKITQNVQNSFIYGKNDHTKAQAKPRNSTIFSLGEKTSAEVRRKHREAQETEDEYFSVLQKMRQRDYLQHLQEKEMRAKLCDEEKKKDLDMLRTYKQPWGKPGGGAPKDDSHRTKEIHHLTNHREQILPLGKPGCGAPLRTNSGSLKANLGVDPEIQFQKRNREQVHSIIMPKSTIQKNDTYLTDLDVLAHETREKRHVIVRDKDFSSTAYNPFGRPGAGAPLYDESGKTKAIRSRNLISNVQETDLSENKLQDTSLPYGTPRLKKTVNQNNQGFAPGFSLSKGGAGAPILDRDGHLVTSKRQTLVKSEDSAIIKCDDDSSNVGGYDPWGKHGAGAPIRDNEGNIVTQVSGRWLHDQMAASPKQRQQREAKKLYLESLKNQVKEHEDYKQMERVSQKEPSSDTSTWLKRGVAGKPPYDDNARELKGTARVTSDIVKQQTEHQSQDRERHRSYHSELDDHHRVNEEKRNKELRQQKELSVKHARTMEGMWGKTGGGAPRQNARRRNDDIVDIPDGTSLPSESKDKNIGMNAWRNSSRAEKEDYVDITPKMRDATYTYQENSQDRLNRSMEKMVNEKPKSCLDAPFGNDFVRPVKREVLLSESLKRKVEIA